MRKYTFIITIVIAVGVLIGLFVVSNKNSEPTQTDANLISRTGVHWHPELTILIKGEQVNIPQELGATAQPHREVHSHSDLPKIHYELAGPVTRDEARLGAFFETWAQPFNFEQILEYKNGAKGKVSMTVNGQPNSEFENYIVKDGDKIEIRYE